MNSAEPNSMIPYYKLKTSEILVRVNMSTDNDDFKQVLGNNNDDFDSNLSFAQQNINTTKQDKKRSKMWGYLWTIGGVLSRI